MSRLVPPADGGFQPEAGLDGRAVLLVAWWRPEGTLAPPPQALAAYWPALDGEQTEPLGPEEADREALRRAAPAALCRVPWDGGELYLCPLEEDPADEEDRLVDRLRGAAELLVRLHPEVGARELAALTHGDPAFWQELAKLARARPGPVAQAVTALADQLDGPFEQRLVEFGLSGARDPARARALLAALPADLGSSAPPGGPSPAERVVLLWQAAQLVGDRGVLARLDPLAIDPEARATLAALRG